MLLLNWLTILILLLEETNISFPITDFIMTYESTIPNINNSAEKQST